VIIDLLFISYTPLTAALVIINFSRSFFMRSSLASRISILTLLEMICHVRRITLVCRLVSYSYFVSYHVYYMSGPRAMNGINLLLSVSLLVCLPLCVRVAGVCTRNREVAGSTHTRSTASNLEQVADLLRAQANSASYDQRDGKWVVAHLVYEMKA